MYGKGPKRFGLYDSGGVCKDRQDDGGVGVILSILWLLHGFLDFFFAFSTSMNFHLLDMLPFSITFQFFHII